MKASSSGEVPRQLHSTSGRPSHIYGSPYPIAQPARTSHLGRVGEPPAVASGSRSDGSQGGEAKAHWTVRRGTKTQRAADPRTAQQASGVYQHALSVMFGQVVRLGTASRR